MVLALRRRRPDARGRWPPRPSCDEHLPELRVRVVNVVDLMRLQAEREHPHGLSDHEFDALFTTRPPGRSSPTTATRGSSTA